MCFLILLEGCTYWVLGKVKVSCSANKKAEKVVATLWQWCYVHGCYTQNSEVRFSFLFVHQLVLVVIPQYENEELITEGLSILKKWNPDWKPRFAMMDKCSAELRAVAAVHPQCFRLLCDFIVLTTPWKICLIWCFCPSSCGHMFSDSNSMLELIQMILQSHSTESSAE